MLNEKESGLVERWVIKKEVKSGKRKKKGGREVCQGINK